MLILQPVNKSHGRYNLYSTCVPRPSAIYLKLFPRTNLCLGSQQPNYTNFKARPSFMFNYPTNDTFFQLNHFQTQK